MNLRKLLLWRDNEVYGHGQILRAHCNRSGTILGHVQHGWNPGTGWELIGKDLLRKRSRRIVWGERQTLRSRDLGIRVRAAIGAPWLYLNLNGGGVVEEISSAPRYIFFPMHGTDMHPLDDRPLSLIEAIEIAGESKLTICLFWRDIQDPSNAYIKLARERGLEVVTAGSPENGSFLENLRLILSAHTHYVSNRVTTSAFYAINLGLEVNFTSSNPRIKGEQFEDSRLVQIASELVSATHDRPALEAIADYELGARYLREPNELSDILGLAYPENLAKYPLLAASALSRISRRVGI